MRTYYDVEVEGPTLVLLDWFAASAENWRMFGCVDALKEGFQLILVGVRGHGLSNKPHDAALFIPETQASDILAMLDEFGIDQAHYDG